MPVNVPTAREIVSRLFLRVSGEAVPLTDLSTISVVRQFVEQAIVEELMRLWAGLVRAADQDWFIQTATGANLDRRLADYGVTRPAAVKAYGLLKITVIGAGTVTIPAGGLVVRTNPATGDPKKYVARSNDLTTDGSWTVADTGTIEVEALDAGEGGNTTAGTISHIEEQTGLTGDAIATVTNEAPLLNGRGELGDNEYRDYFARWLLGLTRSTRAGILVALDGYVDPQTGRRIQSAAIEEWDGTTLLTNVSGTPVVLRVWIDEGITAVAPASLVDAARTLLEGTDEEGTGYRAAGIPMEVRAATHQPVAVTGTIDVDRAYAAETVRLAVLDTITSYFATVPVSGVQVTGASQGAFSYAQMFKRVMQVDGVLRAEFSTPTSDVAIPVGRRAVPGVLAITVNEVL